MLATLATILILLQAATVTGNLAVPDKSGPVGAAQVVLMPEEYAQAFNAEAQRRIDNYWEAYKQDFARNKDLFALVPPLAYKDALDNIVFRMRRDSKVDLSKFILSASGGHFEFRGVPEGTYKIVATASLGGKEYVWTESIEVKALPLFVQMKNRVP